VDLRLSGKRALVTGSSSGIGAGIAHALAAEGVSVVVHGRDRAKAQGVVAEISAAGGTAALALGSLAEDESAEGVADAALAAFGGIDILVNSAGGVVTTGNPDWTDVASDKWQESFSLNVVSVVRLAKRLVPGMEARGWGRIINISSIAGNFWSGRLQDYGAAKAALDHLSGNLSQAVAGKGITVNAIAPGTILTPQAERWIATLREQRGWPDDFAENEKAYCREVLALPIARLGRVAEIAAAAVFLASPLSDYTTGALLRIDGGGARSR